MNKFKEGHRRFSLGFKDQVFTHWIGRCLLGACSVPFLSAVCAAEVPFTGPIEVGGPQKGLEFGSVAWGDYDNDGRLDILASGILARTYQLRVYRNTGTGFAPAFEVAGLNNGLYDGSVAWGDYDNDGRLDILASGSDGTHGQLHVYLDAGYPIANTPPSAPTLAKATYVFTPGGGSTAIFKWDPAVDLGDGATAENGLGYDVQISTQPDFSHMFVQSGRLGAPMRGDWIRPAKIFDGNSRYGLVLTSTTSFGDTVFYYRVRAYDAGLANGPWSETGTLATAPPGAVTDLKVEKGADGGTMVATWTSHGDDGDQGNLTGKYILQYSPDANTIWNSKITPPNAVTVTVPAVNVATGTTQTTTLKGLREGTPYYVVLWTTDDVNAYSPLSNMASGEAKPYPPAAVSDLTVAPGAQVGTLNITWSSPGNDGMAGELTGYYVIQYSTVPGTAWNRTTPPANAVTVTVTATTVPPGRAQTITLTGLTPSVVYYAVLWSGNDVGNYSDLSNRASGKAMEETIAIAETPKVYPSAINPDKGQAAVIRWRPSSTAVVTVRIYSMHGEEVSVPLDHVECQAGQEQNVAWRGVDENNNAVGSGIYVALIDSAGNISRTKIAVVR